MKLFRVLYVEDSLEIREAICQLMQDSGRQIHACETAEEAWDAFSASEFDLVVTDVSLPGFSGTELTRRMVAAKPQQWIVLCTGYRLPQDLSTLGANVRSLPKPFEVEELEATISEIASML